MVLSLLRSTSGKLSFGEASMDSQKLLRMGLTSSCPTQTICTLIFRTKSTQRNGDITGQQGSTVFTKYSRLHQRIWHRMQKLRQTEMAMTCLLQRPVSPSLESMECKGRHGAKRSELMISTMKWLSLVFWQLLSEHGTVQAG